MQTKTKTLTAVAVILAAIPAMGWAQQGASTRPQPPMVDFATADADSSGGISAEEWSAYVATQRTMQRAERLGQRADRLLEAADADGDAMLTRDELIAGFTALDAERREARGEGREMRGHGRDHDRGRDRGRGGMHGHGQGDDQGHGRGHGRGGMHGGMRDGGDRDHGRYGDDDRGGMRSGMSADRAFGWIDRNDDGQIDEAELSAMHDRMQRRMQRSGN